MFARRASSRCCDLHRGAKAPDCDPLHTDLQEAALRCAPAFACPGAEGALHSSPHDRRRDAPEFQNTISDEKEEHHVHGDRTGAEPPQDIWKFCDADTGPVLRRRVLPDFSRHLSLCRRLRLAPDGAEDDRHRRRDLDAPRDLHQSRAALAVRRSAQRHGAAGLQAAVRAVRVARDRAQHICADGEPRADPAVLAMAPDPGHCLGHRKSAARQSRYGRHGAGLADRSLQHVPDQPFRTVRPDAGGQQLCRTRDRADEVQDAGAVSPDPAPDLSRLHHCVLVDADHDGGASAVRRRDDGLHLRRHLSGRARSRRHVRRRVPALSPVCRDADTGDQVEIIVHGESAKSPRAVWRRRRGQRRGRGDGDQGAM